MATPLTMARFSAGSTFITSPCLPLSLPVMTTTWSPFLILSLAISKNLWGKRHDLHVLLGAELAGYRAEDPRADRLALRIDQYRGVPVEADDRAVGPAHALRGAHHHGFHHLALFDAAARDRVLHRDHDGVADRGILALRAAKHLDALHAARA